MALDDIKAEIIRRGKNPNTKAVLEGELRAQDHAREVWERNRVATSGKTIKLLSVAAQTLISAIATLFVLVLIVVGLVGGSIAVGLADYQAVRLGVSVVDEAHATGYAIAIVGFFITLLFVRQLIAGKMERGEVEAFSIRQVMNRLGYVLGIQRNWTPEYIKEKNLLVRIDAAIRFMIITNVIFGVLGRLYEVEMKYASDVPALAGLKNIITQAELKDLLGIVGVLFMTVALLTSLHFIVYFIYSVFVRVAGDVTVVQNFSGASVEEAVEAATLSYYRNLLSKLETSENDLSQQFQQSAVESRQPFDSGYGMIHHDRD